MSMVVYSARNSYQRMENVITWDAHLAISTELLTYQVGQNVIAIFEDQGNHIKILLELLRSNSSLDDPQFKSLLGSLSFVLYDKMTRKIDVFRSITADPIFYYESNGELFVSNRLQSLSR